MQLRTLWRCFAYSNKTEAINIAGRKVLIKAINVAGHKE